MDDLFGEPYCFTNQEKAHHLKLDLLIAVEKLKGRDYKEYFHEPVDTHEVWDYLEHIKKPMDLKTIQRKIKTDAYSNVEEFEKDLDLIAVNCMLYNAKKTDYYKEAAKFSKFSKNILREVRVRVEIHEKKAFLPAAAI